VARLARVLRQQDDSGFGPTLTAALATLVNHGPMTLGDLAGHERVAAPTMSKVVDRLAELGLVTKVPDPDDRRVRRVAATAAGRRQIDAVRVRRTAWLSEQLASLDPDDLARVEGAIPVLEKLTGVTAPAGPDGPPERG
jgi:DNA-binding MarR family transcriptional regulator